MNGDELLDELDAFLGRYIAFPSDSARTAVTLWIVHSHAVEAFESTPRLALLSPRRDPGRHAPSKSWRSSFPNPCTRST